MDFERVLSGIAGFLEGEGFPFALVGGLGLQAYGLARATFDLDLVVAVDAQSKLVWYLEGLGFKTLHCSEGFSNHVHLDANMGRVDLIYVDASTSRRLFAAPMASWTVGTRSVPVPRPEYLAAMKIHAMKNDRSRTFKELADVQFLLGLPAIDEQEVRGYFEKAGLLEKFDELQKLR